MLDFGVESDSALPNARSSKTLNPLNPKPLNPKPPKPLNPEPLHPKPGVSTPELMGVLRVQGHGSQIARGGQQLRTTHHHSSALNVLQSKLLEGGLYGGIYLLLQGLLRGILGV